MPILLQQIFSQNSHFAKWKIFKEKKHVLADKIRLMHLEIQIKYCNVKTLQIIYFMLMHAFYENLKNILQKLVIL